MAEPNHKHISISIRAKLLLVSSTLLIIPWVGYHYIQELESYLRSMQETSLLDRARIVASLLHEQSNLFDVPSEVNSQDSHHVYVRPLRSPIQLDGYAEDWETYNDRMQNYGVEHILFRKMDDQAVTLSFRHQVGSYKGYLYAIFIVHDDKIVYRQPNSLRLDKSDHLLITMQDHGGDLSRYIVSTIAPGWVNAYHLANNPEQDIPEETEVRIQGEWQETADGYNVEIRIPISMIGAKLAFAVADVDDPTKRDILTVISTAGGEKTEELGTVTMAIPQVEELLKGFERPSSRTWVIDKNYRVIALAGSLANNDDDDVDEQSPATSETDPESTNVDDGQSIFSGVMRLFYQLILKQPANEFKDDLVTASRLEGEEVDSALKGQPATHWRLTPDKKVNILTATYPVYIGDQVGGAVAIEETSNSILILQNRAMEALINLSILAFLISTLALLIFASRLSWRVRKLRDEAEMAIGSDGRVKGAISRSKAGDEVGDLSRSFSNILSRLTQYNRYLETMAGKLSHELRTPITVVRSSLDNLEFTDLNDEACTYALRAREGVERLSNILTRMSEATRLEQTLQQEQCKLFDIEEVVEGCVEGYRIGHPNKNFTLNVNKQSPGQNFMVDGAPDLIAQLLDKLVSNAIDFSKEDAPIDISLETYDAKVTLSVLNAGPELPKDMQGSLFDSMVSMRAERSDQPHLGLGLYIVRMIAEFHGGSVIAANREDVQGVRFSVSLPLVGGS